MGRILVVGLCNLDIVHFVDKYPNEDSDNRVFERYLCLGGNAANNVTVLRQFEENCELFSSLPDNDQAFESLIKNAGLNAERALRRSGIESPVSTVIINRSNGSRTVLHYRGNLPEIQAEEFKKIFGDAEALTEFSWIHFEGRNFDQVHLMMDFVRNQRTTGKTKANISVELEKIRAYPFHEELIPLADVIFVSKDFSKNKGWPTKDVAVENILSYSPNATVICPWGEMGAAACQGKSGQMIIQPAFINEQVIDTLGAGDCFIGVSLYYLNKGTPLPEVIKEACRIAGKKCGQKGLLNLV